MPSQSFRKVIREIPLLVTVAAAYFVVARVALLLALGRSAVCPVWPPAGIALAAVLLVGRRALPGIAVGAFLVGYNGGFPIPVALAVAAGISLEAWLGA